MTLERQIRMIAGTFVLVSLVLSQVHSPYWLLFTAFVGLNLFQSSLTGWCLMEDILRKLGGKEQQAHSSISLALLCNLLKLNDYISISYCINSAIAAITRVTTVIGLQEERLWRRHSP